MQEEHFKTGIQKETIAPQWAARGFSCEMWVDPPGQVWADRVHESDQLIMPVTGYMELELADGERLRLKVGEEVLIPKGAVHTLRNQGRTTACWLFGFKKAD